MTRIKPYRILRDPERAFRDRGRAVIYYDSIDGADAGAHTYARLDGKPVKLERMDADGPYPLGIYVFHPLRNEVAVVTL